MFYKNISYKRSIKKAVAAVTVILALSLMLSGCSLLKEAIGITEHSSGSSEQYNRESRASESEGMNSTASDGGNSENEVPGKTQGDPGKESANPDPDIFAGISGYYFNQLDNAQKRIYALIAEGCSNFESVIMLDNEDVDDVYIADYALKRDRPDYFWTDSFVVSTLDGLAVSIEYVVPEDAVSATERIKTITDGIISGIPAGADEYETVRYFYEWIINNTDYNYSQYDQDIRSVFFEGQSVCAGYSNTFQYLCNLAGIESAYATGYSKGESHAWNLVRVNGTYYWVDTTWGDPVFAGDSSMEINYNYLCVSDEEFFADHTLDIDVPLSSGRVITGRFTYPQCPDNSLEYYRMIGAYFETFDENEIDEYILGFFNNGVYTDIELKFSNENDYRAAMDYLFAGADPRVFELVREAEPDYYGSMYNSYSYIEDAHYIMLSITFGS